MARSFVFLGKVQMDTGNITSRSAKILKPILEEHDLELVEITYRTEGGRWILRVTIDHEDGVRVEHCTKASRELGVHLDVDDLVPVKYHLEVSSPGINRPLKTEKDFDRFSGKLVAIKTHRSVSGRKKINGTLEGIEDGTVRVLLEEGNTLEIQLEDISSARLDHKF